ncbi:hypothetical protein RJ639_029346 [Escallonia herrerae]|uniref:CCHC-type domain-containing protein n=1 Tax=Escallonia herrerae TaxID=1293975 RepID=A0AA88X2T0_9ASTE|nr:hypothetical protein RJ639_029346 [Escallonia herrerae]
MDGNLDSCCPATTNITSYKNLKFVIQYGEGKMLYARTARSLAILLENVPMRLSATTVDSLGEAEHYLPSSVHKHMAAECMSKTMCWNCKEPGHLASECNNDPICHVCNKTGHLARDCSESSDPRVCNNCFKPGHIAVDCTNEKACNRCRKAGHIARECPNDAVCNLCNVSGHLARQCPKTAVASQIVGGPFRDIFCRSCGGPGHISRDCVAIMICNCCGGRGHMALECPTAARTFDRYYPRNAQSPPENLHRRATSNPQPSFACTFTCTATDFESPHRCCCSAVSCIDIQAGLNKSCRKPLKQTHSTTSTIGFTFTDLSTKQTLSRGPGGTAGQPLAIKPSRAL